MNHTSPFSTPDQKRAVREAKRHAVLVAAVRMFNERGFHATSLDDVAASLGISKPTIYHYLGNKEQVLIECLRTGLDQLIATVERASEESGSGADRLCRFLTDYGAFNLSDFGRCVVLTNERELSAPAADQFRAMKRRFHEMMREIIVDGIEDGSVHTDDPTLLAFTLAGALNWPPRWYDPKGALGPQELAAKMVSTLAAGFVPR